MGGISGERRISDQVYTFGCCATTMFWGEKTELFRRRKASRAGLSDPRLLERLLDFGLLESYDDFVADDHGGSGPPSCSPGQLLQVFGVFDYILLYEGNPFLREKLPRRLAGVSGRVKINDDRLIHDEFSLKSFEFRVSGFGLKTQSFVVNLKLETRNSKLFKTFSSAVPIPGPRSPGSAPYPLPAGS